MKVEEEKIQLTWAQARVSTRESHLQGVIVREHDTYIKPLEHIHSVNTNCPQLLIQWGSDLSRKVFTSVAYFVRHISHFQYLPLPILDTSNT